MRYNVFIPIIALLFNSLAAQNRQVNSSIDNLLAQGNYEKVIDTCKLILASGDLNPELYYKIGLAYQNLQEIDSSIYNFRRSHSLNPENNLYTFMLAKGYYNKGKNTEAEPLFFKLCSIDSVRWISNRHLYAIW
jgi:tetratricopeptide (TPR) repeat protein